MAQEIKNQIDRDCQIAAILATGGIDGNRSAEYMVERFSSILRELHKAGSTYEMWVSAQDKQNKNPTP